MDLGNLYRLLRSLEEEGVVASVWDESLAGPAKRVYRLTPSGEELLDDMGGRARGRARPGDRLPGTAREGEGGEHMRHGPHRHHGPRCGSRRMERFSVDREEWLARLEEHQRDLEQRTADVADLIRRLKTDPAPPAPETATA